MNTPRGISWTLWAFAVAALFICGLIVWQLFGLTPAHWCAIAKVASRSDLGACVTVLIRVLDIKDHTIIGLISILAVIVIGLVVVALGITVHFRAGPEGGEADIRSDTAKTEVLTTTKTEVRPSPDSPKVGG